MNHKAIFSTLRKMLMAEGFLLLLPMIVSIIYGEDFKPFLFVAVFLIIVGGVKNLKASTDPIYTKDGIVIVGLCWLLWSAFGALPFVISGSIPNFIDAFFEVVSGFTTTGSSILTEVESLPKGMLFWRSFTHWVGGMGVLVFVSALIPLVKSRSMSILRAEMPGPNADKLVPKTKQTAQILYIIYFVLSAIMTVLLMCGGMPLFDSLCTMFGTAGTGGFSVRNASIAAYGSPYAEIVITVFMCLFSLNFSVYFLLLVRKFKTVAKNEEMWTFIGLFVVSTAIITWNVLSYGNYSDTGEAVRASAFQVSSIMSTSGFSTANFSNWPWLSQCLLFILMLIGACAGSTGGGMKVVRLVLTRKIIKRDLKKIARPKDVSKIRLDGNVVEESMLSGVKTYMLIYFVIFFVSFTILMFEGKDLVTTISSVATCFNNIGPGLGDIVGPAGNFSSWSYFGKIILSLDMLLGRLEIYPILLLFMPAVWKKKSI